MIEINLLPEELKGNFKSKKLGIEPSYFLYLIPAIFGIILTAHIYLAVFSIVKNYQFRFLSDKWQKLQPQREILESFNKEYEVLSSDAKRIDELIYSRINWSQKLNKLSLNLPAGVWLNEVSFTPKDFVLKGASVSLQREEMSLINKFIDNLKNDTDFFKDFNNLELGPIQRKVIAGYDIVDFVLQGTLKQ